MHKVIKQLLEAAGFTRHTLLLMIIVLEVSYKGLKSIVIAFK